MPISAAKIIVFFFLSFDYIPVHDKRSLYPSGLLPDIYSVCFRIMFPENLTNSNCSARTLVQYSLQNGFMYEALLSISPAGCGQIVTLFITLSLIKFCLLIHFNIV